MHGNARFQADILDMRVHLQQIFAIYEHLEVNMSLICMGALQDLKVVKLISRALILLRNK